ncbi:unnamed protein product, partial [Adineta ricciae]
SYNIPSKHATCISRFYIVYTDLDAARYYKKSPSLLVGQILGPTGSTIRNLSRLLPTVNVFKKDGTLFRSSEERHMANIFPLDYSIPLTNYNPELDDMKDF